MPDERLTDELHAAQHYARSLIEASLDQFVAIKVPTDPQYVRNLQHEGVAIHGLKHANMIKTGERTFCIIAEWTDMDSLAKARPNMIATLDSFRDTLEDLGGGVGVTDPVSGSVVMALK